MSRIEMIAEDVRRFVQARPYVVRSATVLHDALFAMRSIATWGGGLGRGSQNERAAGMFNRACYAVDGFIYDIETELWALYTLDQADYAQWLAEM